METQRKYKHVLWYSLFVAAYLIVLYLQASAYNSGEVVSTLRQALMPGQSQLRIPNKTPMHVLFKNVLVLSETCLCLVTLWDSLRVIRTQGNRKQEAGPLQGANASHIVCRGSYACAGRGNAFCMLAFLTVPLQPCFENITYLSLCYKVHLARHLSRVLVKYSLRR